MFYVGQEVICVRRKPWTKYDTKGTVLPGPAFMEKVTVVDIYIICDGVIGLELSEYPTSHPMRGYYYKEFRPIQKKSTDISVFEEMLRDAKVEEPA